MSSGGHGTLRPYPAIVPIELTLALAVPVTAVLLVDLYWVPMAIFVITAVPAGIALYVNGFLPVPRSAVLIGAGLYAAGGLLSTLVTTGASFSEFISLLWPIVFILYFLFLLSLVPLLRESDAKLVLLVMVLACGANAGINVLLFLGGDPRAAVFDGSRLFAAIGTPGGKLPTVVSVRCAVFFAAAFALAASSGSSRAVRILAGVAAVPIGVMLVLSLGRGGYLGALAGVLSVVPFVTRRVRMLVAAGVVAMLLLCFYGPVFDTLFGKGASLRTDIWQDYLGWAWESPVIGQGLLADIRRVIEGFTISHPHNLLLSAQIRGGLLGLAGMALMLGGGLYWSWIHARRSGDPVFLAMIVAISVAGMFDYELLLTPTDWRWVTFWLPIGLAAGAELAARRDLAAALDGRKGKPRPDRRAVVV